MIVNGKVVSKTAPTVVDINATSNNLPFNLISGISDLSE